MTKMIQLRNVPDALHRNFNASIWQLRHNFSAYDAAYVVLSERLGAPLITRNRRLASTSGHAATIELF